MKKLGQLLGMPLLFAGLVFVWMPRLWAQAANFNAVHIVTPTAQPGDDSKETEQVATFQGRIVLLNGRLFILRDDANATWYHLDDQKTAAGFAGKQVTVTGVLDARSDMIRVRNIRQTT